MKHNREEFPVAESGWIVTDGCSSENLSTDDGGVLRPLPTVALRPRLPGAEPVMIIAGEGSSAEVLTADGLTVAIEDASTGGSTELTTLAAPLLHGVSTGRELILMTNEGARRIADLGDGCGRRVLPDAGCYPPVMVRRVAVETIETDIEGIALGGTYTDTSRRFTSTDSRAIGATLLDAYGRVKATALRRQLFVGPVMVGYELLTASGQVRHRSQPVKIAPTDSGDDALPRVDFTAMDGWTRTQPTKLTMAASRIEVEVAPGGDWGDVTHLRVFATPMIDVVDAKSPMQYGFFGAGRFAATARAAYGHWSIEGRMLDRRRQWDTALHIAINPQADAPQRTPLCPLATSGGHESMLSRKADARDSLWMLGAPHGFAARSSSVAGDVMVWADITPVMSLPQSLSEWAVTTAADEPWQAVVRVTLDHGNGQREILSTKSAASTHAPLLLSATVSYPHPAARLMEIALTRPSGTRQICVSLTPTPDGLFSIGHLSPDALVRALPTAGTTPALAPIVSRKPRRMAGHVLTAAMADPLAPIAMVEASTAAIVAVTPAVRSTSTWDFGRRHFYAFGLGGTHALAVSHGGMTIGTQLIDSRPIGHAKRVVWTPAGVYAAAEGDQLLRFVGSRGVHMAYDLGVQELGWCGATRRLWLTQRGPSALVMGSDGYMSTLILPGSSAYHLCRSVGDGRVALYGRTSMALLPADLRRAMTPIKWQYRKACGGSGRVYAPRAVRIGMWAATADITITVCGDNGCVGDCLMPIATHHAEGAIDGSIDVAVFAFTSCRYYTITIEGHVSGDAIISSVTLQL